MSCPSLHKRSEQLLELSWKDSLTMSGRIALHTKKLVAVLGSPSLEQCSNLPSEGIADGLGSLTRAGVGVRCNSLHFDPKTGKCNRHGLILDHAAYMQLRGCLQQLLKSTDKKTGSGHIPSPLHWCVTSGKKITFLRHGVPMPRNFLHWSTAEFLLCSLKAFSYSLTNSLGIHFWLSMCFKGRLYQRDTMAVFCVEDVD